MVAPDLIDAQTAIDWAEQQFPILKDRVERWADSSATGIKAEGGRKAYYLTIDPLPAMINAEAGAIINSIRSSLDLLASALAARNGFPGSRKIQFPVCESLANFQKLKINELSAADLASIASLRPYKGGDDMLYALHELDNTRKHRRLVKAIPFARGIGIQSVDGSIVIPQYNSAWQDFSDIVPVLHTDATAADCTVSLGGVYVAFDEPAAVVHGQQIVIAIPKFTSLAASIIARF